MKGNMINHKARVVYCKSEVISQIKADWYSIMVCKYVARSESECFIGFIMDIFKGACGIILTLNLPKNQQKSFFGNNSHIFTHFHLKIVEQILCTMIDISDSFQK